MDISVNDLRQGVIFLQDGKYYEVESFKRHKMARGKGVVKVEARDLETSNTRELSFRSGDSVKEAESKKYNLEFVYHDERRDQVTLQKVEEKPDRAEQRGKTATRKDAERKVTRVKVAAELVRVDNLGFLSEGTQVMVTEADGKIVSIEIPPTVKLKVTMAPPGDKGDTAGSATKKVKLETGMKVDVPLFVESGDLIEVNTGSGEYRGRVSN